MLERRLAHLVALALLALLLLNFPTLALVDRLSFADLPILPFYLFGIWAVVIALAAWLIERGGEA